jgi:hypothetical protein
MKMDRLGIGGCHASSWKKDMFNEEGYQVMEYITYFLSHHLNDKTWSREMEASRMLIDKEDASMFTWILGLHQCKLSIYLIQLKI